MVGEAGRETTSGVVVTTACPKVTAFKLLMIAGMTFDRGDCTPVGSSNVNDPFKLTAAVPLVLIVSDINPPYKNMIVPVHVICVVVPLIGVATLIAIPAEKFNMARTDGGMMTVPEAAIGIAQTVPVVAVVAVLKNMMKPAVAVADVMASP